MSTVRPGGERNVDSVIDNKWHLCFVAECVQAACQLEQLERCCRLGSQLDGGYSAAQGGRHSLRQLLRRGQPSICEQVQAECFAKAIGIPVQHPVWPTRVTPRPSRLAASSYDDPSPRRECLIAILLPFTNGTKSKVAGAPPAC